jgi:hypothetical protein
MPLQSYSQPFSMPLPLHNTWKRFMSMRKVCLEKRHASLAGTYIGMHFSQARISYRHTSLLGICTSLLDAHFSLACISLDRTSYFCVSHRRVSYRGVFHRAYIPEVCVSWTGASLRMYASHGRVSFAGMHLKSLHLIGAYISQDVRLRCVYLMGVALSQACIAVPKPPYPNCVP